MNRWQKFGAMGALVALLSVSQPAAAQTGWVFETIEMYRAWQDGRLLEELGWMAVRKFGEKLLEDTPAPEAAPPQSASGESPPLTFDLDGTQYLLAREDAIALEEGDTYLMSYCPLDSDARLFVHPSTTCPNGSAPQASDYAVNRVGNTVTAERKTP